MTSRDNGGPRFLERWFVVFALALFSHGFFIFLYDSLDAAIDPSETRPLNQAIFISIYLGTVLASFRWRREIVAAIRHTPWVWLLVGMAALSTTWSAVPEVTSRRSVALIGTTLFGAYLGTRFPVRDQLRLWMWAATLLGVASLLTVVFLPDYGLVQVTHVGAWRGVFGEKNTLGRFSAFSLLVVACSYGDARREGGVWPLWVVTAIFAILLVMSESATALTVVVLLAGLWPLFQMLRKDGRLIVSSLMLFAALAIGAGAISKEITEAAFTWLGRDATLTGRTDLWTVVLDAIGDRPFLGHGFGAFWLGWNGPSADVWAAIGFLTPHSHNGVLDLMLDVGWSGAALFLLSYADGVVKAARGVRQGTGSADAWPIVFLLFMALYNVTESSILRQNSIYWVMYVSTLTALAPVRVNARADLAPTEHLDSTNHHASAFRPNLIGSRAMQMPTVR